MTHLAPKTTTAFTPLIHFHPHHNFTTPILNSTFCCLAVDIIFAIMVEKKYIKIGVASLAVVALVIGLSVGITQSRKNKNSSAASASETYSNYAIDVCDDYSGGSYGSAKSGKSGSGGSKGAKSSGGGSYSGSGKSGKGSSYSGSKKSSRRRLVVPGTEEYQPAAVHSNQRRKLRQQLVTGEF